MGPGSLGRTDVYMYTLKQNKRLPDMKHPRYNHACSYYYDGQTLVSTREYRPTMWAFLLGPAGGNSLPFLLLKATHKNKLTCYLKYFIRMR